MAILACQTRQACQTSLVSQACLAIQACPTSLVYRTIQACLESLACQICLASLASQACLACQAGLACLTSLASQASLTSLACQACMASSVTVIINQPGLCPCLVISNLDFDKRRKKKKEKEEEEKKFGNSKPRHFPKEMAEAKTHKIFGPQTCNCCSCFSMIFSSSLCPAEFTVVGSIYSFKLMNYLDKSEST